MSEKKLPRTLIHATWFIQFSNGRIIKNIHNGYETPFYTVRAQCKNLTPVRVGWTYFSEEEAVKANKSELGKKFLFIPDSLTEQSIEIPPGITLDNIRPYMETDFTVDFDARGDKRVFHIAGKEYCIAFDDKDNPIISTNIIRLYPY